jgi:hypothetical protein
LPTGLSFCLSANSAYVRGKWETTAWKQAAKTKPPSAPTNAELHFLAALVDELMKALLATGTMSRSQLQDIETAVSARTGSAARAW